MHSRPGAYSPAVRRAPAACRSASNARADAQLARELGVAWHTVMNAVREYGQALIDDPERVGQVRGLGVDETTWLTATREHPTRFATSMVDLARRIVIDVVEGQLG